MAVFLDRIDHFVFDVEYYLSKKVREYRKLGHLTVSFYRVPCNSAPVEMVRRKSWVHSVVKIFYHANKIVPFSLSHIIRPAREITESRDIDQQVKRTPRQLEFSSNEIQTGTDYLRGLCFQEGDWFVCLFVRDSNYLSQLSDRDYSYHDYHDYHDLGIGTYEKGALALAEKWYWIFRVGTFPEKKFYVDHDKIVDYASSQDSSDLLAI